MLQTENNSGAARLFVGRQPKAIVNRKYHKALTAEINAAKIQNSQMGFTKKFKIIFFISVSALLLIGAIIGIILGVNDYNSGLIRINQTEELIDRLPDTIEDYGKFEEDIIAIYDLWTSLSSGEQNKVKNREKFLPIRDAYNKYKLTELREELKAIDESASDICPAVSIYQRMNEEQTKLLSREEINRLNAYVQEFQELFTFQRTKDGTYAVKVKDAEALSGAIVLPAEYEGKKVTSIPEGAFKNCIYLTEVVIPNTVTEIGSGAFQGCTSVESLSLPFTGKSADAEAEEAVLGYIFGGRTFESSPVSNTYSKEFVHKDEGPGYDGAVCQYSCYDADNNEYDWYKYDYCLRSYYYFIPTSLKTVTVTNQKEAKISAFNGCENIEKIKFVKGLNAINGYAFHRCVKLSGLNSETPGMANLTGVTGTIGERSFRKCTSITSIKFDKELREIALGAFAWCENVETLELPQNLVTIGGWAFANLNKITEITVPNSVEIIDKGAFQSCSSVVNVSLPFTGRSRDAKLYESTFGYVFDYGIRGDDFSETAATDGYYSNDAKYTASEGEVWQITLCVPTDIRYEFYFYIPVSLKTVTITNQTEVKLAAFNGCTMLTDITYTNGIEKTGDYAFQNCNATVHDGLKTENQQGENG